jgi:hypothetical protein
MRAPNTPTRKIHRSVSMARMPVGVGRSDPNAPLERAGTEIGHRGACWTQSGTRGSTAPRPISKVGVRVTEYLRPSRGLVRIVRRLSPTGRRCGPRDSNPPVFDLGHPHRSVTMPCEVFRRRRRQAGEVTPSIPGRSQGAADGGNGHEFWTPGALANETELLGARNLGEIGGIRSTAQCPSC